MTTSELLDALGQECPNGVSFDPMAVRLIRNKVPFKDWQIDELKTVMCQLGSGLWFTREMISDDESWLAFENQTLEWLIEYGCFSVEQLFKDFCGLLQHIATPEDCVALLRHLDFTIAVWEKGDHLCFLPPPKLNEILVATSEKIAGWLEESDGMLTFNEIEQAMPHLTATALDGIREHFLPEVHEVEVCGLPCWRSSRSITLPEDFSEKLTIVVDTLVALDESVTVKKLEFALNLFYRTRLREEYSILDNDTFMRICAKHYRGGNYVFPKKRARKSK